MSLRIRGAREHNLRDVDLDLPKGALIAFVGVSGSGKSSLAFDTLHAEGRRRFLDALSPRLREQAGVGARPDVDAIQGLAPTLGVAQRPGRSPGARATVGSLTDADALLRVLYARAGAQRCPDCGRPIQSTPPDRIVDDLMACPDGARIALLGPRVRGATGGHRPLLLGMEAEGFVRARVDGTIQRIEDMTPLDARIPHDIDAVVDRIRLRPDRRPRLAEAVILALRVGGGRMIALVDREERFYSDDAWCGDCGKSWPAPSVRRLSWRSPAGACADCGGTGLAQAEGEEDAPADGAICEACDGAKLGPVGRNVLLGERSLPALSAAPLADAIPWLAELSLPASLAPAREELARRLALMDQLGLGYLALSRPAPTLSTGEAQRLRLADVAGSDLAGVVYVIDEPTAGLHPDEVPRIVDALRALRDRGNTVIAVEHDASVVAAADWCVEFGPGAGPGGGQVIFEGTPADLLAADTPSGRWLSGRSQAELTARPAPKTPRYVGVKGATGRNLQGVDARFPIGRLSVLSGPSGAGKSSLIFDTLLPALRSDPGLPCASVQGRFERIRAAGAKPLGKSPRSSVASWMGFWAPVRALYAMTREAKVRGYTASYFSLNTAGGRCPTCQGQGRVVVDLGFVAGVESVCEVCEGRRYERAALAARWRGLDISQLLALTASEARAALAGHRSIEGPLRAMESVGLGYLRLGQGAHTLSGGEARRLRLAREIGRADADTLYLIDEPSAGLHLQDLAGVADALRQLTEAGATVIAVDSHPLLVAAADFAMALGPGGGPDGGRVVSG